MKGFNRTASLPAVVPSIALAADLGNAAHKSNKAAAPWMTSKPEGAGGASSRSPLLEGTLYVARSADSRGPAAWDPFRFAHHPDGSISFRAAKGSSQKIASNDGVALPSEQLSGLPSGGSSEELYLDADWRQPFVAAPWKPLTRAGGAVLQPGPTKETFAAELFPFTLSYAPARPKAGDVDAVRSRRRTVVLAAPSARARTRWLATLARKAHSPELRVNATVSVPGSTSVPSGRKIGTLGEEHVGLPTKVGRGASMPRLPAGPVSLFDSHSSLRIVRDLYDGYAADPLSQNDRGQKQLATDSDSSGTGPPSTSSTKKSKFLERYLDRQSEIENLLDHHWSGGTAPPASSPPIVLEESSTRSLPIGTAKELTRHIYTKLGKDSRGGGAAAVGTLGRRPEDWGALFPNRVKLLDRTTNVAFEATSNILSNAQWSGGAIFQPPDDKSFRLTICPLDSLDEHPIFIGLAPPDADLTMVSFYSSGGGVFLCAGGCPSGDLISALGAPGGPAFFCFGERKFASLPKPEPGQTISMHYTEGQNGGQVRFFITEANGDEVQSDHPPLGVGLPPGPWRPCVLLCMPGTRVHIVRLI